MNRGKSTLSATGLALFLFFTGTAGASDSKPPPSLAAPPYLQALTRGRDLLLDHEYEEARRFFEDYTKNHSEDAAGPFGSALVEIIEQVEVADYTQSNRIDAVLERAHESAETWFEKNPRNLFAKFLLGASEGIEALWLIKTDRQLRGYSRAISAIDHVEDAVDAPDGDPDAKGAMGLAYYAIGKYKPRYLPFFSDTRAKGRAALERCVKDAPLMGPLCELFLIYVAKWERRWDDVDKLASSFRKRYPGSLFAGGTHGQGLFGAQRYEEALSVYIDLSQRHPEHPGIHYWAGRVYWDGLHQGKPAQEMWEYALSKNLKPPKAAADAQAGLGEVALEQGLAAEAKIRFDWAQKLDPKNPRAKNGLKKLKELEKK
ncbi:MAG: tetratricopeptide repeat protein [Bdellovibrionota bacterium]